jgi:hypothetical protein
VVGEVDQFIFVEARVQREVHQTGQTLRPHLRHAGDRSRIEHAIAHDAQASRALRNQDAAVGEKRHAPGRCWMPVSRTMGPSARAIGSPAARWACARGRLAARNWARLRTPARTSTAVVTSKPIQERRFIEVLLHRSHTPRHRANALRASVFQSRPPCPHSGCRLKPAGTPARNPGICGARLVSRTGQDLPPVGQCDLPPIRHVGTVTIERGMTIRPTFEILYSTCEKRSLQRNQPRPWVPK